MKFTNLAKGQITQTIAKMLFERAGYRVTRFGIEELFYEVVHLDQKRYLDLGLPLNLRSLPDFLVADPAISMVNLVEVKFRKRFSEESAINLYETLRHQFAHWPNAACMLMVSEAPNGGKFHQDYIRVVNSSNLDYLRSNEWNSSGSIVTPMQQIIGNKYRINGPAGIWDMLTPLYDAFALFSHSAERTWWKDADEITQALRDLSNLSG